LSPAREVRVGVIGLGFMGRVHLAAYDAARAEGWPCRVVSLCDRKVARLAAAAERDGEAVETTTDPATFLARRDLDLVSICTRTDSHVDLAIAALEAGKHVLVEKPVGLTADAVAHLALAASHAGTRCVPAHCMRFWPGWDTLHEAVRSGIHGRVLSATFQRLSSPPAWSPEFYADPAASGGALVDLHVHDADFVRWCFGDPVEVWSTGSLDHVTTLYRFPRGGPEHVFAEGGWNHSPGFGFRMRFVVVFERATLDFEFSRDPRLVLHQEGRAEPVALEPHAGYDGEVRHVIDLITGQAEKPIVTIEDALGVACLLDAERESLATGAPVVVG
jgi:predicted dehydrogenase